jgi:hypothetical protein
VPLAQACAPKSSVHSLYSQLRIAELRAWMRPQDPVAGPAAGPAVDTAGPMPALATAGPGSGLTTLVRLLVRELDLEAVWTWCGLPNIRALLETAARSARGVTLRPKIIVVDEVDAMDSATLADVVAFVKTRPPAKVLLLAHTMRSQKPLEFAKKWPVFAFGKPSETTLRAYLARVVREHGLPADDQDLQRLARQAAGDVRAALTALDIMSRGRSGKTDGASDAVQEHQNFKDEFADPLDLVDAVLRAQRGATVAEGLWLHEMEGATVSAGLYENYLGCLEADDLRTACLVSEAYSVADVGDEHMFSRQLWELQDACGALAVAAPAMHLHARPRRSTSACAAPVSKFGSLWSKMYNACAKTKHAKTLFLAYAQHGCAVPSACELAYVRGMLRDCLVNRAAGHEQLLRRCCWPLAPAQVMCLARLTPGGSAWYKPGLHARVKGLLAAPS